MRSTGLILSSLLALLTAAAMAQPVIDGSAQDPLYGAALAVQDTQTGFGDSNIGRPDLANGSELDAAYGVVYDDTLYLVLAGNFESNGNRVEIFFDTVPGQGQNQLLGVENPDVDYQALQRMGYLDPNYPGLAFASEWYADYYITVNCYGDPAIVHVSYAELYVDELHPGVGYYAGAGPATCDTSDGQLTGGTPGAPNIRCTVDNRNAAGVGYGYDWDPNAAGVLTGLELAIPLSALGNPSSAIGITAFINSQGHDSMSNQLLGGIGASPPYNLGDPRWVDLSIWTPFHMPFWVPISTEPRGACCVGNTCSVTTESGCLGEYLGDNVSCDGNPCDTIPSGACCFDDGYSGLCEILTAGDCSAQGGTYQGDGSDCLGCPCLLPPTGACCIAETCYVLDEPNCIASGGSYAGDFTDCGYISCAIGACCVVHECSVGHEFECAYAGGRFLGADSDCSGSPCDQTIWTPYVAGDWNGWDSMADAMIEVTPGIYEATFLLDPWARYEFKITDGTWDNSLPGANCWLYTEDTGEVTITYDANIYDDGWAPAWDRIGLSVDLGSWNAVGDWQGWDPADPNTVMTPLGGGIYVHDVTNLPAGVYYWKAVVSSTWDGIGWNERSVYPADMQFGVADESDTASLYVDALTGKVKIELAHDCNGNDISDALDIAQCDGSPWCDDCNQNGVPDECDIAAGTAEDLNGNGIPDECEGCPQPGASGAYCHADIFGDDCVVNLQDLAQLLGNYGMTSGATLEDGDVFPLLDGDGAVNLQDLAELLGEYGDNCN